MQPYDLDRAPLASLHQRLPWGQGFWQDLQHVPSCNHLQEIPGTTNATATYPGPEEWNLIAFTGPNKGPGCGPTGISLGSAKYANYHE